MPPALRNITYKIFIIFGVLCFAAAVQAFFTYPETCGKTLEEIEILFSHEGPKPWHTKPGQSRLDAEIEAVGRRKDVGDTAYDHRQSQGDEEKTLAGKDEPKHVESVSHDNERRSEL